MSSRQETQNKRRAMREDIIEMCRSGEKAPGAVFPTVRELARQYGLSINSASEVVQSLVAEGILHARPGAGTRAAMQPPANTGTYLFLLPAGMSREYMAASFVGAMQRGFEVSIAESGGSCLTLEANQARRYADGGQLPQLAGIFALDCETLSAMSSIQGIPLACFADSVSSEAANIIGCDTVRFDDIQGGQQATRHLISAGYKSIAFVGLHAPPNPGEFEWSAQREEGWRKAMFAANQSCDDLAFHPSRTPSWRLHRTMSNDQGAEQREAAREAAAPLVNAIRKGKVTAVIAANFFAAQALFGVFQEAFIPPESWPAVVCFDSADGLDNHVVSALNLPWDNAGKAGAQLLWERNVGRLRGPNTERLVPMQLIPRLTCRRDWSETSGLVVPHLELLSMPRIEHGLVKAAA